jgi:hypothetical protein
MALLGTDYRSMVERTMPRKLFGAWPHSHVALAGAIEQGALFCAMLTANPRAQTAPHGSST